MKLACQFQEIATACISIDDDKLMDLQVAS
jgi:hypothetical protein